MCIFSRCASFAVMICISSHLHELGYIFLPIKLSILDQRQNPIIFLLKMSLVLFSVWIDFTPFFLHNVYEEVCLCWMCQLIFCVEFSRLGMGSATARESIKWIKFTTHVKLMMLIRTASSGNYQNLHLRWRCNDS